VSAEQEACTDCLEMAGTGAGGLGDCWAVCRCHPSFPPQLFDLDDRVPPVVFGVGERALLDRFDRDGAVTIVGSRRATPYGLGVARELGHLLAAAGLVVVSGMAFGIDSAAHDGALEGGGTTLAVLGGGADVAYPPSKRGLHRRILRGGGAAISERPPGVRPEKWAFPARNRIMAAIAGMTVVVEGAEPSGSLITAEEVVRLNRGLGAVPGPVSSRTSAGPHALIRDGAALIRDAQDVLDEMLGVGATSIRAVGPPLDPSLAKALALVEAGSETVDALSRAAGEAPRDSAVALARLELMGYVVGGPDGGYTRTALVAP
jgi:DNA processing protein